MKLIRIADYVIVLGHKKSCLITGAAFFIEFDLLLIRPMSRQPLRSFHVQLPQHHELVALMALIPR